MSIAEFSGWLMWVLWGRILRGRHHGTRLWNCLDVKWLWRILTWWWTWWNHSWHSNLKSALFCLHSSPHSSVVLISCYFSKSEPQRCFWLLPISGLPRAAIRRIAWGPNRRCKLMRNKFQIREYSPKNNEHCRGSYSTFVLITQCRTRTCWRRVETLGQHQVGMNLQSHAQHQLWISTWRIFHEFYKTMVKAIL